MIGALSRYISDESVKKFQPMGANLGIMIPLEEAVRDKRIRAEKYSERSFAALRKFINDNGI